MARGGHLLTSLVHGPQCQSVRALGGFLDVVGVPDCGAPHAISWAWNCPTTPPRLPGRVRAHLQALAEPSPLLARPRTGLPLTAAQSSQPRTHWLRRMFGERGPARGPFLGVRATCAWWERVWWPLYSGVSVSPSWDTPRAQTAAWPTWGHPALRAPQPPGRAGPQSRVWPALLGKGAAGWRGLLACPLPPTLAD